MTDTAWIVVGAIAVVLIIAFLYLKYKNPTEASTIEADVQAELAKIRTSISAELSKLRAEVGSALTKATPTGATGAPTPAPVPTPPPAQPVAVAPPAVPTVTPAGTVPTAAAITELEAATTSFHQAHARLTTAAKAVAAP